MTKVQTNPTACKGLCPLSLCATKSIILLMSQPFKLFRLQQIDSQLDRLQARLAEIESLLSDDTARKLAAAEHADVQAELKIKYKALKHAEEEVRNQRLKIEQNESTLYGGKVRNPKELQDMQNEIAALKRYLSVLEDRQLEAMMDAETCEEAEQAAAMRLQAAESVFAGLRQTLEAERSGLENEVEHASSERQAAAATIPEADLKLYEQLRRQRKGLAVAKVSDRYCSACGTVLSTALLHAARSSTELNRCEVCGRILYAG